MIRRPPRSTQSRSSAASDVYKRQVCEVPLVRVVEVCGVGCGVKIDGTDEDGEPPLQAATATAMSMAPAAERAPMSQRPRAVTGRGATGRIWTGWVVTGMVRRTFMKPPRTRGGRWRRAFLTDTVYSSICHCGRPRKSEWADSR